MFSFIHSHTNLVLCAGYEEEEDDVGDEEAHTQVEVYGCTGSMDGATEQECQDTKE